MGKRGPAPKPTALKKLEGTYRPDREALNAPEPEPGIPELPDGWGESTRWGPEAVEEYYRMAPALKRLGLLAQVDRAALLLYCDAWGEWIYYRDRVGEDGDTSETSNGTIVESVEAKRMDKAAAKLKKYLALFGLSPSDRTRVSSLAGTPETRNPFQDIQSA